MNTSDNMTSVLIIWTRVVPQDKASKDHRRVSEISDTSNTIRNSRIADFATRGAREDNRLEIRSYRWVFRTAIG